MPCPVASNCCRGPSDLLQRFAGRRRSDAVVARSAACTAVNELRWNLLTGAGVLVEDSTDDVPGAFIGGCIDHSRYND